MNDFLAIAAAGGFVLGFFWGLPSLVGAVARARRSREHRAVRRATRPMSPLIREALELGMDQ